MEPIFAGRDARAASGGEHHLGEEERRSTACPPAQRMTFARGRPPAWLLRAADRLVTQTPERLNLEVLPALCEILACSPSDLVEVHASTRQRKAAQGAVHPARNSRGPKATAPTTGDDGGSWPRLRS